MRESKLKKSRSNVNTNKEKSNQGRHSRAASHVCTALKASRQTDHSLLGFKTQKQYKQDIINNIKNSECKIWPLGPSLT